MFPNVNSQVYYNEEGEVLGWDNPSEADPYEPDDGFGPEPYDEDDGDDQATE